MSLCKFNTLIAVSHFAIFVNLSIFGGSNICNGDFSLLLLHTENECQSCSKDPAEMCDTTELQDNAGIICRLHYNQLKKLHWVERGNYLRHQLGNNDHNYTSQQPSLQEYSLHPLGNFKKKSISSAVDCGQLGSKENQTDHKHLDFI